MCDQHVPIVVYDTGGTQLFCENCGKPLGEWKPNSGSGVHEKVRKEPVQAVHSKIEYEGRIKDEQ